jgi:cyanophycinase
MVLEREHAEDADLIKGIEGAGVIYFTGGNPDHLLAAIRDSHLWSAILAAMERGTVLAGSSAGAMVMGSLMRRPRLGQWIEGLAVAPGIAVLPHHERSNPEETSRDLQGQVPPNTIVFGIDARTGCLGSPGNWRVVGSGKVTVYRGTEWSVYQSGDNLSSDV